jgi:serine/threonine-protein kinase
MTVDGAAKRGGTPEGNVTETVRRPALAAIPVMRLGKYNLIGKLGHGGMAEVFLAYIAGPAGFRKLVVVKRLHDHLLDEPGFLEMFLDEARLAARLNHPNVVQTQEVGEFDRQFFLAMEFLEGQPLDRIRKRCARNDLFPPPRLIAKIVAEALEGLSYAHRLTDYDGTPLNVIHRDISPHNVFVTYEGMVKLLDFGIAKASTHVSETQDGVVKGKFAYIAPEQGRGYAIDQRADLWSMGVVLWESLANRRLFKGPNDMATLNAALSAPIPSLAEVGVQIPDALVRICTKALLRDPGRRYQTAQEMKDDLEAYLAQEPKPTSRKDVATFVTNLFADVIEQHRSLLEVCLSRSSSSETACTDLLDGREGTPSGVRLAFPLGSSLQTPSSVSARPPFRGTGASPEPRTPSSSSARPPPHPAAVPRPAAPPPRQDLDAPPAIGPVEAPVPAPAAPVPPIAWETFSEPITGSSPLDLPKRGRRGIKPLLLLAGLVLFAVVSTCMLVRVFVWTGHDGTAGGMVAAGATEQVVPPAVPVPVATGPVPAPIPAGSEPEDSASESREPQVETQPPPSGEVGDPGVQPVVERPPSNAARPEPRSPRPASQPRHPTPAPEPPSDDDVEVRPEPRNPGAAASPASESNQEPAPAVADEEAGFLSLDTVPWSRVSFNGRVLGTTPLLRVRMPAGTHILSLHNPEANITTTYRVTIRAGETTARRLGLE